jgi:hypothetical protein
MDVTAFDGDGVDDMAVGGPGRTASRVAHADGMSLYPGDNGDGIEDADLIVDAARVNPFYLETPEPNDAAWSFKWFGYKPPVAVWRAVLNCGQRMRSIGGAGTSRSAARPASGRLNRELDCIEVLAHEIVDGVRRPPLPPARPVRHRRLLRVEPNLEPATRGPGWTRPAGWSRS